MEIRFARGFHRVCRGKSDEQSESAFRDERKRRSGVSKFWRGFFGEISFFFFFFFDDDDDDDDDGDSRRGDSWLADIVLVERKEKALTANQRKVSGDVRRYG